MEAAVGTPELIRDARRVRVPSLERVRALWEILEVEFYVGPKTTKDSGDIPWLEQALETAGRVPAETGREAGAGRQDEGRVRGPRPHRRGARQSGRHPRGESDRGIRQEAEHAGSGGQPGEGGQDPKPSARRA